MRARRSRPLAALAAAAALLVPTGAALASPTPDPIPEKFGTDSADPQIPDRPVDRPSGAPTCSIKILTHGFNDYSVQERPVEIPESCGDEWSTAVLRLDGSVDGVQYDRAGWITLGDATVMRLSTPEPSAEGISWSVEQDVTRYQDVLSDGESTVSMYLGNTVNETYTGVFDVTLTLDLYAGDAPATVPDEVIALSGAEQDTGDLVGQVRMPRNSTRVTAEVYVIGSGGGCAEFWDLSAPAEAETWCKDGYPHREVQVMIDGKLAGTALPYAVVYTGGWSNPYMWMPTPSPYAFNIPALQYDLTPFAGLLNDGASHEVRVHVVGHPQDGTGWSLMPNLFAWTDESVDHIPGAVTQTGAEDLQRKESVTGSGAKGGSVQGSYAQQVTTSGYLDLPSGRVRTTVTRDQSFDIEHSWTADGDRDDMDEASRDRETVLTQKVTRRGKVGPGTEATREVTWSKQGFQNTAPHPSVKDARTIRTELDIRHATAESTARVNPHGKRNVTDASTVTSTYDGFGEWAAGVPRAERVATAGSTATYTVTDKHGRTEYARTLVSKNGWYVED